MFVSNSIIVIMIQFSYNQNDNFINNEAGHNINMPKWVLSFTMLIEISSFVLCCGRFGWESLSWDLNIEYSGVNHIHDRHRKRREHTILYWTDDDIVPKNSNQSQFFVCMP